MSHLLQDRGHSPHSSNALGMNGLVQEHIVEQHPDAQLAYLEVQLINKRTYRCRRSVQISGHVSANGTQHRGGIPDSPCDHMLGEVAEQRRHTPRSRRYAAARWLE